MFALCISWSLALQLFLPCRISRGRTPQRRSQKGCFKHRMSEVQGLGDVRATCPLSQGHSWPAVAFCLLCATLCADGAGTRGLASRLAPPGMSLPCSTQEHRENSGERTDQLSPAEFRIEGGTQKTIKVGLKEGWNMKKHIHLATMTKGQGDCHSPRRLGSVLFHSMASKPLQANKQAISKPSKLKDV